MSDERTRSGRFFSDSSREFLAVVFRVAILALVAIFIGVILFARSLEKREQRDPTPADGIVVLTGGADRINDALLLLERGKGRRLVISGVNIHAPMEALKRRWPGRERLFECCVDLDYQARNTYGNAVEARRWAQGQGFRSIILVTSSYHVPRAMLEFEYAMPGVSIQPYPVVPEASKINRWWQDPTLFRIIVFEFLKYWAASIRHTLGFSGG